MKILVLGITILWFAGVAGAVEKDYYMIDHTHSHIMLQVKSRGFFSMKGQFTKFSGRFYYDSANGLQPSGEIIIKSNSIRTGNHKNDLILSSRNFLNSREFPEIKFKPKRVEKIEEGKYRLIADLTIKGVTKETEFEASYAGEGIDRCKYKRVALTAKGEINRKDFGIGYNSSAGGSNLDIGERVTLNIDISGALVSTSQRSFGCGNTPASRRQM